MKKSLLLMAVLSITAAVFVKAQDPVTWLANTYCTQNSIAADAVALTIGQQIQVGDLTFTAQDKPDGGWLYKVTTDPDFVFNGVTYSASMVQGQGNPKNGVPMPSDVWSAVAVFNSTSNGSLDVAFKFGYNKKFWVAAIPVADMDDVLLSDSAAVSAYAYEFATDQTYWGGYFDPSVTPPSYYFATTANADPGGTYYTGVTLDIKKDYNYYLFFSGSKLMLCGLTYTATPVVKEYAVSGTVKTETGTAVEGVLITSSDSKTATTDASGAYSIASITEASITLTPSKTNFTFNPATLTLAMDKDYTNQDFIATDITIAIPRQVSGTVATSDGTPVEGVLVTSTDGKTATTNASGEYLIKDITETSITLTPSKTNYTFTPASITLTMDKDYSDQNFVAAIVDGINDSQISSATLISTEYYNILGKKLEKPQSEGLYIIIRKFSNGTVKTEKTYIFK